MTSIVLPGGHRHTLRGGPAAPRGAAPSTSRVVYGAAHVVADPLAENVPGAPAVLDWDATMAFRHHLWSHGLGVAEAMDTAQRGMGIDYPAVRSLIQRTVREAHSVGGKVVAGVATDHLEGPATLGEVLDAYRRQLADVVEAGAQPVLMCSRHLAAVAKGPADYLYVYSTLLSEVDTPVVLHWLGEMFDPALAGYWGSAATEATDTVLSLIKEHDRVVDGIKMSLLDKDLEIAFRRRLPAGVRMFTGDDFNYPELIAGDEEGHSDALLGVFAVLAPLVGPALGLLDEGDTAGFRAVLDPTVPLARHLFGAPTQFYKTGIVFLSWLAGHQDHFTMVGGLQSGRSATHLARLLVLADEVGLLPDAELAAARARAFFTTCGVR
ncbi:dihydrodipicolinate synthase family protein [Actinokineospora sp. HUAS TT18]|uniref:dihydrodipicolinate synthase family protein n=1 Tax=Actinokineospora sp. HUAS TT18 TaxID=3447451 RepID=UPI003F51B288